MNNIPLRPKDKEWLLLTDFSYQQAKSNLKNKISLLFSETAKELHQLLAETRLNLLPAEAVTSKPKITQGENYKGGSWMVLDYPRVFDKENIFALRLMCWWGKGFYLTFHIAGRYAEKYKPALLYHLTDEYVCTSDSQWIHEINTEDWEPVKKINIDAAIQSNWIKPGVFFEMNEWENIPALTVKHARKWFEYLNG